MFFHPAIFVVSNEVSDGILRRQIAHQSGIGLDLGIGERILCSVAHVFNADGVMVEADAVSGHPCLWNQAIDGAVAVYQEVRRDVHFAGSRKLFPCTFGMRAIKVVPCGPGKN